MLVVIFLFGEILNAFPGVEKVFLHLLYGVGSGHGTAWDEWYRNDNVKEGFGDEIVEKK